MIQTGLIPNAHQDLVTDASYDFYGLKLATCSLDQRIKIWQLDESSGIWNVQDDWRAHDAPVSKLSWAHPEFGTILASSSFDRTVKVWEQTLVPAIEGNTNGTSSGAPQSSVSSQSTRWIERTVLADAKGTVRAVEFGPHHFGLKLATISSDSHLRIYECLEQPSLTTWQLTEELDVDLLPSPVSSLSLSRTHTLAFATPTQTSATLEGASASLVAQALQQGLQQPAGPTTQQGRMGMGHREADGGWCVSWCKDKYWGEVLAAGASISGTVKIIQFSPSRRPTTLLVLDPNPTDTAPSSPVIPSNTSSISKAGNTIPNANSPNTAINTPSANQNQDQSGSTAAQADSEARQAAFAITSVSWAPSCGRSYHLIATGGRDGCVRIWRVNPGEDIDEAERAGDGEDEEGKWSASVIAEFDQHRASVGRVEWNITGTVLSSAGNDGRIRLWKATAGNVWRPAGSISVEQTEESDSSAGNRDADMDS